MTERVTTAISREERERLRTIADVVFPRTAEMPSAGDVGACDMLVDRVVRAVPPLAADASAALAATASRGLPCGTAVGDAVSAAAAFERGFSFVMVSNDAGIFGQAAAELGAAVAADLNRMRGST